MFLRQKGFILTNKICHPKRYTILSYYYSSMKMNCTSDTSCQSDLNGAANPIVKSIYYRYFSRNQLILKSSYTNLLIYFLYIAYRKCQELKNNR